MKPTPKHTPQSHKIEREGQRLYSGLRGRFARASVADSRGSDRMLRQLFKDNKGGK